MADQGPEFGHRTRSADMKVGTRLRRGRNGGVVVLGRRKDPNAHDGDIPWSPGWWIDGGGGLADDVIDDPAYGWEVADPQVEPVLSWKDPDVTVEEVRRARERARAFGLIEGALIVLVAWLVLLVTGDTVSPAIVVGPIAIGLWVLATNRRGKGLP